MFPNSFIVDRSFQGGISVAVLLRLVYSVLVQLMYCSVVSFRVIETLFGSFGGLCL